MGFRVLALFLPLLPLVEEGLASGATGTLPWEQGDLQGGFVFRVDADGDRVLACTTGGSFVRAGDADRWTRIDPVGPERGSPLRLLAGRLWSERDGTVCCRNEKTGAWEAGPAIGGNLFDAVALPGPGAGILWAAIRPTGEAGGELFLTRGAGAPRRIAAVPRREPGWNTAPRLAVAPDAPGRIRLALPFRDPTTTWVVGMESEDDAGHLWSLPFYLHALAAVPGKPECWIGVSLVTGTEGELLGLVRSDDGGRTFREAGGDPRLRNLRTMAFHPGTGHLLLGAMDGAVLQTPDLGETLTVRREGGGADHVTSIAAVPGSPDRIRVGTQAGFYRTEDGGKSWAWDARGMAAAQTVGLVAGEKGRVLLFEFHQGPRISTDGGRTWSAFDPAFKLRHGSIYAAPSAGDAIALDTGGFGRAAHCLLSRDLGRSWTVVDADFGKRWVAGVLPDGDLFAGDRTLGLLRLAKENGWREASLAEDDALVNRVLPAGDGGLLLVKEDGVLRLDPGPESRPRSVPLPAGSLLPRFTTDPVLPDIGYIQDRDCNLHRGRIGAPDWKVVLRREGTFFAGIAADPGRPDRRIAGFSDGFFALSEDRGSTWRAMEEGRFRSLVHLAVGPDRRLYVAADGTIHILDLAALDRD